MTFRKDMNHEHLLAAQAQFNVQDCNKTGRAIPHDMASPVQFPINMASSHYYYTGMKQLKHFLKCLAHNGKMTLDKP